MLKFRLNEKGGSVHSLEEYCESAICLLPSISAYTACTTGPLRPLVRHLRPYIHEIYYIYPIGKPLTVKFTVSAIRTDMNKLEDLAILD